MIPKYLKIKGLYSYQKEQEIHFDALTDASLFGIFGAVGSGKSSILEAITFALYGDTERLNRSGDDRTYNMMNLRSDELLIDFECVAGKVGDLYRFTVRGRRNSKNFKEVKTFDRRGYIRRDDSWIPLADHETTESIIGLSYDNFRRTIIIPQGRFQEFIELKDAERTRMMKELFQLEKYDLSRNVGSLSKQNDLELSNLDGQLLGLGEVTAEMITAEENGRDLIKQQIKESQEKLLVVTEQEGQFLKLKLVFDKLAILVNQLNLLESEQAVMAKREEVLRVFEVCSIHFKTFLDQKKSLSAAIQNDRQTLDKNLLRVAELAAVLLKQRETITALQPRFEARETLLDMAQELEKVISIKDNVQASERNKAALARGEEKLVEKEAAILLLKEQRAAREVENEAKKSLLTDVTELSQVKSWFATLDEIQVNKNLVYNEGIGLKKEIELRKSELTEKINNAGNSFGFQILPEPTLDIIQDEVQKFLVANEGQRQELAQQTIAISTRRELQRFASNLEEGEPCPLCGAQHHPAVLHMDTNLSAELQEKERQQNALHQLAESLRQFHSKVQRDFVHVESLEKQIRTFRIRYKESTDRLEGHNQLFTWDKFDKNDREGFDKYFADSIQLQKDIRETELDVKKMAGTIESQVLEKEEKIAKPLQNLRDEILKIDSTISTLSQQLEKIRLTDFDGLEKPMILERIVGLRKEYDEIGILFEKATREIDLLEKERDTLSGSQSMLVSGLERSENELANIQNEINRQLAVHEFESEVVVTEILRRPIDIASEKRVLDEFKVALNNTKRDLENLRLESAGQVYVAEKYEAILKEKEILTVTLNQERKEEGRLEGLLKKMAADLARKVHLLAEKSRLQLRKEHLDDLARLFRSSGFVDYASSIYLQNLIQAANHRFHQMTHQQLHLELGEGNSFWVRDLLNGGHMRLLKTLSGGQKFQAALSLALALADHIHVRNQSVHNFFFLDEGFGSLDKNALKTVFETLKSLRKENRIVGIISHVEDLQQEIQTYLRIEESEEGSKIIASWE
jgi:exonuclease SbcC